MIPRKILLIPTSLPLDPLDVSAQNDRLQHELDLTKTENRHLTKQMQTWKEQLIDIGEFLFIIRLFKSQF